MMEARHRWPLSASYPDSSLDVSYSYDQGAGQKGRLTGITDGSGTTALVYDVFGNLLEDTRTIAAEVLQTSYSYDGAHQLMSVTYPSGRTMNYIRDTVGRITSVSTDFGGQNQTVLSSAQYLPFGPLAGFTFGNGIAVERAHDQQYRLDELTGGGVEDLDYAYDPAGNIDAITDHLNVSFSRAFAQDALDRLTSDQGAFGTRTYRYDSVGNRTGRWLDASPEQAITVVSNSNRLATINAAAVSYDAAGNVLADDTGRTFGYNDLNRLATASVSGQTVATYAYNAFGQRARKIETASNTSTVFAYAPGGQLLAERRLRSDGTRELEREYLWLDSLPIAMAERSYAADGTTVTASQFVYLHADHLDTPRLATDAAQRVVWRWRSDAFGIGVAETDPDGDSVTTEVALRFPGQYFDAETGRYAESDPIGLQGGLNTYVYALSNPIRNIDSKGLWSTADLALAGHFYSQKGGYVDISAWCGDYMADPMMKAQVQILKQKIDAAAQQLVGLKGHAQFSIRQSSSLYIESIHSFGAGDIHSQTADCEADGDGCCVNVNCKLRMDAADQYDDPLDLCQYYGKCGPIRNVGGTPFWFGLTCFSEYSTRRCKR